MDDFPFEERLRILESVVAGLINVPSDLAQLRIEMRERFDVIDQRFDAIDRRFEANDRRFDANDRRFDAVDRRLDGVELELHSFQDVVVAHFIRLERRMNEGFEESRRMTRVLHEDLVSRIAAIGEGRR